MPKANVKAVEIKTIHLELTEEEAGILTSFLGQIRSTNYEGCTIAETKLVNIYKVLSACKIDVPEVQAFYDIDHKRRLTPIYVEHRN